MVRRGLQLCLIELPLSESTGARLLFLLLAPLPGTHLVIYGEAEVPGRGGGLLHLGMVL